MALSPEAASSQQTHCPTNNRRFAPKLPHRRHQLFCHKHAGLDDSAALQTPQHAVPLFVLNFKADVAKDKSFGMAWSPSKVVVQQCPLPQC
jgi:hypothetical protein